MTKTKKGTTKKAKPEPLTLVKSHRQVLGTLAAAKAPMTRREIADVVAKVDKLHLGRISRETLTYKELTDAGYITVSEATGEGEKTTYRIAAKGRAALAAAAK